ncbi:MAG: hypothetical protein QW244_00390 [Candidatus Pacearchaeota archaeon]
MKITRDKNFKKYNFDITILSFPSNTNLTNMILANIMGKLKPKIIAKASFDELPVAIVSGGNIFSPSIDFYYKKINGNSYCFVIANYKPREIEAYKKIYEIIKRSNEIIILNEVKGSEFFYIRNEHRKPKIKLDKIKTKFKKIDNAIIKGIPAFVFDAAKKDKSNITVLFFNTNPESIEDGIKIFNDAINIDVKIDGLEKKQITQSKSQENKSKNNKFSYVG